MQTQGQLYALTETIQTKTALFSNMPFTLGNIAGLFTVGLIMFLTCMLINKKMVTADAKEIQ